MVSRWHCMQTSISRAGARRAGLTMAARIASTRRLPLGGLDVALARSMASLAIDSFAAACPRRRGSARSCSWPAGISG